MDFRSILTIAISAPISLSIIMLGLYRMRGKARATIGTDGKLAVEIGEAPERRETDRPDGVGRLAAALIPLLTEALDNHACQRRGIIDALAEGQAAMYDRSIELCDYAIQSKGMNGPVTKAKDEMDRHRVILRKAMANPGGA